MKLYYYRIFLLLVSLFQVYSGLLDNLSLLRLKGGGKIVGGHPVKPAFMYSFVVSIQYENKQSCGGTLLTYNKVLTAAHCVFDDISKFSVHGHRQDLNKSDQEEMGWSTNVINRIVHPNFETSAKGYDISIWTINRTSTDASSQPTVNYPNLDPGELASTSNLRLTAIGWGRLFEKGPVANILQEVQLPIVDQDKCAINYKQRNLNLDHNTMLCAGYFEKEGMDTCQGDSGGPLFVSIKTQTYIVGVVSYGIGCASPDLPGIYAKVSYMLPFIQANI